MILIVCDENRPSADAAAPLGRISVASALQSPLQPRPLPSYETEGHRSNPVRRVDATRASGEGLASPLEMGFHSPSFSRYKGVHVRLTTKPVDLPITGFREATRPGRLKRGRSLRWGPRGTGPLAWNWSLTAERGRQQHRSPMSTAMDRIDVSDRFRGELLQPGDAAFESASRIRNMRVQGRPAVVARCLGAADVAAALRIARDRGLEVSVRGGGHSIGGWSSNDGGLVVDLTLMRQVRIDPETQTAWVGGGTLSGDLLVEGERFGLVPVTGAAASIGIAGLATGLGESYLTPRLGYAIDHLLAFELVTADGSVLDVSATSHPDLFWAMRGAGPNFGVITALKLQLHPAPEQVVGGSIIFDGADAGPLSREIWRTMAEGSEYFWPQFVYRVGPSGQLQIRVIPGHTGTPNLARREIDALCEVLEPVVDERLVMSYTDLIFYEPDTSSREEWDLLRFSLDGDHEEQIRALLEQAQVRGDQGLTPCRSILLWRSVVPPPPDSPGAAPRYEGITVLPYTVWHDPAEDAAELGWIRRTGDALREAGVVEVAGNTMNHVSSTTDSQVRDVYGAEAYERLANIKARYDPENLFRRNFNIPPAPDQVRDISANPG